MEAELAKKFFLDLSCSRSRNGVNILGDSDPDSLGIDVQKDVLKLDLREEEPRLPVLLSIMDRFEPYH